jgi:hypothetical protein
LEQLVGLKLSQQPIPNKDLCNTRSFSTLHADPQTCEMLEDRSLIRHSTLLNQTQKICE